MVAGYSSSTRTRRIYNIPKEYKERAGMDMGQQTARAELDAGSMRKIVGLGLSSVSTEVMCSSEIVFAPLFQYRSLNLAHVHASNGDVTLKLGIRANLAFRKVKSTSRYWILTCPLSPSWEHGTYTHTVCSYGEGR